MSCTPFLFVLILISLSLFTDFCRIFAPYLERPLICDKVSLISSYGILFNLNVSSMNLE